MRYLRNRAGLTLLEVIIAMSLLGIALLGLAAAFPAARYAVHQGQQLTKVANLAQDAIEKARRMGVSALGDNTSTGVQDITSSFLMPAGYSDYTRTVQVQNLQILSGVATLKRLTVVVTYEVAGDPVTSTTDTLLAR